MEKHFLRKLAEMEDCTAEIIGYCSYDPTTTVLAHHRPGFFGMAMKPDDIMAAYMCSCCHDVVDGRTKHDISPENIEIIWHSAIVKTLKRITNRYDIKLTRKKK